MSDGVLLTILLRTGRKGQTAIELGREMLERFGGLTGLLAARQEDILQVKGVGKAMIAQILAAMKIVKRQVWQPLKKTNGKNGVCPYFSGLVIEADILFQTDRLHDPVEETAVERD